MSAPEPHSPRGGRTRPPLDTLQRFFLHVQRDAKLIAKAHRSPFGYSRALLEGEPKGRLAEPWTRAKLELDFEQQCYAISAAYSLLMGRKRRKALSAYFTPPGLSKAVLDAAIPYLAASPDSKALDPSCGGGSFLVPLARRLIESDVANGYRAGDACRNALSRIRGIEIDRGLARLSGALLQAAVQRYAPVTVPRDKVIHRADALAVQYQHRVDLVIGNPPYGRVLDRLPQAMLNRSGEANIGGHTNIYSLFLLRALDWLKPGGGLVFVLPTSFAGGPYFSGLRKEILRRASVKRIDLHEQRENLFVGAVQDVCILTLERRFESTPRENVESYALGMVEDDGTRRISGHAEISGEGRPWELPLNRRVILHPSVGETRAVTKASTFLDFGYEIRVGHVVPTRTREQLHPRKAKGRVPVVWASAVRPDGSFSFDAAKDLENRQWFEPKHMGFHVTRRPTVILQRTSNRDQTRRLNAAAVPESFRIEHAETGFVGENHVITFEAVNPAPPIDPEALARLLNSSVLNERFSSLSGSFSVSARLLKQMALPPVDQLPDSSVSATYETSLRQAFSRIDTLLVDIERDNQRADQGSTIIRGGGRQQDLELRIAVPIRR